MFALFDDKGMASGDILALEHEAVSPNRIMLHHPSEIFTLS